MSTTTITVGEIRFREVNTKYGLKKAYDIYDVAGKRYGFGFTDPTSKGISVGTTVSGYVTTGKYGNDLDAKTITVGGTNLVPAASAPPQDTGGRRGPFPINKLSGEMAIIRQNALTNAVATVADWVATLDPESWPKLDVWSDHVIDIAYKYAEFSSGQREVAAQKRLASIGVDTVTEAISDE